MVFINRDELEGLRREANRVPELESHCLQLEGELAVSREAVVIAGVGAAAARAALEGSDGLGIIDTAARERAREAAEKATHEEIVEQRSQELQAAEGTRWATAYREQHEAGIVEKLRTQYEQDGTFAAIRRKVESEQQEDINQTVLETVRAQITAELEAARPQAEADAKTLYLESYNGERLREQLTKELKNQVATMMPEAVAAELKDELLQQFLAERAKQLKRDQERQNRAHELADQFERGGIKTADIEEGSQVILTLGELETTTYPEKDRNGWTTGKVKERTVCHEVRSLKLTALGGQRFMVDADSLGRSKSVYERAVAITPGTVIMLGRELNDNGKRQLNGSLSADVELHFDTDHSTPEEFRSFRAPLANVTVDGVPARTFHSDPS